MTLKELLFTLCNDNEDSSKTILDTNNDSFPEEYRMKKIHYAELFTVIARKDYSFLDKKIKSLSLQSVYPDNDIVLRTLDFTKNNITTVLKVRLENEI